jgi:predicted Rossmann-fold nucleotide-binding protein
MQVFVAGTWKPDVAAAYIEQASLLGERLALAHVDLACGPGTGISRHVVDAFRQVAGRGVVRYYLPTEEAMRAAGERVEFGADEIEQTPYDYAMRNTYQVSCSDAVFVLTGGDGTLEEILPALIDYRIPVAVVERSGSAAIAVERLLDLYPAWCENLMLGADVASLIDAFLERLLGANRAT